MRTIYALFVLAALVGPVACGGPARSSADVSLSKLPVWEGRSAELFNDGLDPAVLGLTMEKPIYRGDLLFRERCKSAEFVGRMKITTVTEGTNDGKKTIILGFTGVERLAGGTPPATLEASFRQGSPSFGLIERTQAKLRGKAVVVAWRTFRQDGEAVVHAFVAPDDPEVVAAVHENVALEELSKL